MLAQMIEFFLSAFRFAGLIWSLIILAIAELVLDRGYKGEVFSLTDLGYKVADTIEL